MKSTERRHLKENELAHSISAARDFIEPRKKQLTGALVAIALIAIAVMLVVVIRERTDSRGQDLLGQAMVALNARVVPAAPGDPTDLPAAATFGATGTFSTEEAKLKAAVPKLKAAADAYPEADAGIQARYHLAGAYASLGQTATPCASSMMWPSGQATTACTGGWPTGEGRYAVARQPDRCGDNVVEGTGDAEG